MGGGGGRGEEKRANERNIYLEIRDGLSLREFVDLQPDNT